MASSSRSSPSVPASSARTWKYDVFLSFRGEDTRKTFVDHLYLALKDRSIHTYKDDVTLLRGDTIGPSLLNAIEESQIAIIIFSKNYANSSWCLDELAYIMKCREERGQTVIPVFYHVEPTDVRKQKGEFGKAFDKVTKDKTITKTESWIKALGDASNIAGWEPKHIAGGHEAKCIKDIVGSILDKLLYLNSIVNENLIGMGTRLQDLKSRLVIGSSGVRMIGIWGIGGGGKTTLASSLYIEIRNKFDSCCFVENIKEESKMKTLQEKILSTVLKTERKVESVDIGKNTMKGMLRSRNVLIVLDDVDDCKQLEALAGSHDWFGDGSRIIITTRDEHLLRSHKVDEIHEISLLSHDEAIKLFNKHAYKETNPVEDYEMLSLRVVSYASGLPLALKVLGSFLCDKDKDEWIGTLKRLEGNPEMEIVEKLKISYDGLKPLEKELFLDIACFCRGKKKDESMVMLDACGFHPGIGVKVLRQKCLITINSLEDYTGKYDIFEMHDLVQEMGHYIVRGEQPNNPEKHTRLWLKEQIDEMCSGNEKKEINNIEAIMTYNCPSGFGKFLLKAKKLRMLTVYNLLPKAKKLRMLTLQKKDKEVPEYLSNELQYMHWERYPASLFPESFQPWKLVVLRLDNSLQVELWSGCKCLPCLQELELHGAQSLVRTPDFGGLPCLQKLILDGCSSLEEIHSTLGNHSSLVYMHIDRCWKLKEFPAIVNMGKLETLEISTCYALSKFPKMEANMESLVNLSFTDVGIEALPSSFEEYCTNLRSLKLRNIEGNPIKLPKDIFKDNTCIKELCIYGMRHLSIFYVPRSLKRLVLSNCELKDGEIPCDICELSNLQELDLSDNEFSRLNFSLLQLTRLKLLNVSDCRELVQLPELPTSIAILEADKCNSLEVDGDIFNINFKWLSQVSFRGVRSVIGGNRLLQTMLQGHAAENGCMSLHLKGIEIPKGFVPRLLKGCRYRLKLPENWYIHFSGFLFCAAGRGGRSNIGQTISMKHEKSGSTTCMDSQRDVYWKESVDVVEETWVEYVSFGLLKHTTWWDSTSTNIEFSFEVDVSLFPRWSCSGVGVSLVSKTSETSQLLKTTTNSSSDDYKCNFRIKHDSRSHLKGKVFPKRDLWWV